MPGLVVVPAAGDARERGLEVGRTLGDAIGRSLAFHAARLGIDPASAARLLAPHRAAAQRHLPDLVRMLDGMAAGAEVDPWGLFALNALEELEPLLERSPLPRCTTVTVTAPGTTLVGHAEQWYAGDAGEVAVVVERPSDSRPRCASATVPSYLAAVGINEHGVAQGIDSLVADDDRPGIPRALVARHALDARDRRDALRRAGVPGRAGGYAHVFARAGGEAFVVETTAKAAAVVEGAGAHANHYLDPGLAALAPPPRPGTAGRHARACELLAGEPVTPEALMRLLADHAAQPDAICLHADPAGGPDEERVLFGMVCDLEAGRMWVAPGNPCETPFEEVDLFDVLA